MGVFTNFDLSPVSMRGIHYLKDLQQDLNFCEVIGDKGCLSADSQLILLHQLQFKPYPTLFRKSRKRIQTLFSQLCDQFMIRRNYAK
ncbi:MAG: hypothetical protein RR034_05645 [Bacteroidales bacterium]